MPCLSRFITISRGPRGLLGIAIAGSILATALSVVPALISRQVLVTFGQPRGSSGTLIWLGLAMVAATAAIAVARYFEGGFGHNAAFKILHDVRLRRYEQMLRLTMGLHTKQPPGAVAAHIIGSAETLACATAPARRSRRGERLLL